MTGTRGPLPKPAALKMLEGNPGKRTFDLAAGINPRIEIPSPPKHLSSEARKEWKRITPLLEELGLISGLDRTALALYCQAAGRLAELETAFNGKVDLLMSERGLDYPSAVYEASQQCMETYGQPLTNVVYMGMGEPLLAYSSTMESVALLTEPFGLNMSPKRITVSTAGIAKMIKKLADENVKFNLALSLHAADDVKRNEIMPINEQNNLELLMESLSYFYHKTGNKISYEYIAFQNFNDSIDDAKNLVKLCKLFPVKVNIIEYNPIDGSEYVKADEVKIDNFARHLRLNDIMVTIRRSRGKYIDAACGQLANKE